MTSRRTSRWTWLGGLLAVALVAGAAMTVWQPSALAKDNPDAKATGPTEQEIASIESISRVFHKVAEKATPAVVRIHINTGMAVAKADADGEDENGNDNEDKGEQPNLEDLPEPFKRFFKFKDQEDLKKFFERHQFRTPSPRPRMGMGSGVIIDAKNGYVLTSNHVVEGAEPDQVRVYLADKRYFTPEWIRTDEKTDVAVLKLKSPDNLSELRLGDSGKVRVGDWVLAIGSPFGSHLTKTVTFGIVSATGRELVTLDIDYGSFIQTDAAINPGNSGGPLVNLRGEVIGINTAIAAPGLSHQNAGIGFAMPSNIVKWVATQLIEHEEVVRGYLGVSISSLEDSPGMAASFGLKEDRGVLVNDMFDKGPAKKAGMRVGDVILEVNGTKVRNASHLQGIVAMLRPGTKAEFKVWRDEQAKTLTVTIGEQPEGFRTRMTGERPFVEPEEPKEDTVETLGIKVAPLTEANGKKYKWSGDEGGLLVTEVERGSELGGMGLSAGDLILEVQRKPVKTVEDLRKVATKDALREGLLFYVKSHRTRSGMHLFVKNR